MTKLPPPSRQVVRLKVALGFRASAIVVLCAGVPLLGGPWWANLVGAVVTVCLLQLVHMRWALIRPCAPLLPLLDAIAPYTRDIAPGHARVFDRIGDDTAVLCLAGRRATDRTFLRASEDDIRALVDSAPGERVRAVADQIMITGPIAVQYPVVDSTATDPWQIRALSLIQRFAMARLNAKTGLLLPTTADMNALLHHLRDSDFVKDITRPGAGNRG